MALTKKIYIYIYNNLCFSSEGGNLRPFLIAESIDLRALIKKVKLF